MQYNEKGLLLIAWERSYLDIIINIHCSYSSSIRIKHCKPNIGKEEPNHDEKYSVFKETLVSKAIFLVSLHRL